MIPSGLIVGILAAGAFCDDGGQPPARPALILYVQDRVPMPGPVAVAAFAAVTRIFDAIGITIRWRDGKPKASASTEADILIQVAVENAAKNDRHHGVAYSAPFGRGAAPIRIRYDRLQELLPHHRELDAILLARVLAHEIAHVLQGSDRHSESGLMKAHWSRDDCARMLQRPLEFTPEDVDRMWRGLSAVRLARSNQK